jgi:hypothetical protein
MIEPLLLIGGFLITLLTGLSSIWQIRGYLRTGMKAYLYWGIFSIVALVMFLGMPIVLMSSDFWGEYTFSIIMGALFVTAYYFKTSAASNILYDERVAWQQMCEKTTYWQRLTGNVPILEHQKPRPLPISKRNGLILGILFTTLGTIVTVAFILFEVPMVTTNIFKAGIVALILGPLLIIFSVICLEKYKKRPEERTE